MGFSPKKNRIQITRPSDRIFVIRYRDRFLEDTICKSGHVVDFFNHPYTLHPFQAVMPQDPKFMEYAVNLVTNHKNFNKKFDTVLALAQRSIPLAVYFSQKTKKFLNVVYSKQYEKTDPEMEESHFIIKEFKKYYKTTILHSYFLKKNSVVTFVGDDMNWAEGSIATLHALHDRGIKIANFVIGVEKKERHGVEYLVKELKKFGDTIPVTNIHVCASISIGKKLLKPIK